MTEISFHTAELGRLYEAQGYYEKAGEHFEAVLANDPENPALREAVERVSARAKGADGMARLKGLVDRWVSLLFLKRRAALLGHGQRSDA